MNSITLDHITHKYQQKEVLNDFSFRFEGVKTTCIIGPSGCGKTTILRLVAGLETPAAGFVTIGDRRMSGDGIIEVPPHKRGVGFVFQDLALWPHFTVKQNIAFGLKVKKEKNFESRITDLLELFQIGDKINKYPHQLSGGQKQLVAIARSVILKPDILLLDEPLANIDTHIKQNILKLLKELQHQQNFTMLYVTHDHREAFKTADTILVLNKGKIVISGTKDEIINSSNSFVQSFLET